MVLLTGLYSPGSSQSVISATSRHLDRSTYYPIMALIELINVNKRCCRRYLYEHDKWMLYIGETLDVIPFIFSHYI